jgi:hypothetical protein
MTKRRQWLIVALCSAALTAAGYRWFFGGWTVERVERLIRSEVKADWTRPELEAWLTAHGFTHDHLDWHGWMGEEAIDAWELRRLPGRGTGGVIAPFQRGGVIQSDLRPANVDWFWAGWIKVDFTFDKDGKVAAYSIHGIPDAP